jgi:hypothetical protein
MLKLIAGFNVLAVCRFYKIHDHGCEGHEGFTVTSIRGQIPPSVWQCWETTPVGPAVIMQPASQARKSRDSPRNSVPDLVTAGDVSKASNLETSSSRFASSAIMRAVVDSPNVERHPPRHPPHNHRQIASSKLTHTFSAPAPGLSAQIKGRGRYRQTTVLCR